MAHFNNDNEGKKFGMWLFLLSEILLFGVIFILYSVYFWQYHADFIKGSHYLDLFYGTFNTVILLISSFLVAASITAVRKQQKKLAIFCLITTIIIAVIFLYNKYIEWGHKFHLEMIPNSDWMKQQPEGINLFFGLYYLTTGLHALHVVIGATLICFPLVLIFKNKVNHKQYVFLENAGLYWHLVDLIWIFVFPLYYLAR